MCLMNAKFEWKDARDEELEYSTRIRKNISAHHELRFESACTVCINRDRQAEDWVRARNAGRVGWIAGAWKEESANAGGRQKSGDAEKP